MATIKDSLEKNTLKVGLATLLLKDLGDRDGQFVWKKFDAPHFTLKFIVTNSTSPFNLRVDCAEVDLSTVDASWFVGIKGVWNGNGYYEFPNESTLRIFDATSTYDFASTWNANTQSFTVTSATGIGDTSQFADYVADGQFMDYTVADAEDSYPNGGVHADGYWYELVKERDLSLEMFGCTKMAIDKMIFSSEAYVGDVYLSHSLGEKPTTAFLIGGVQESNYITKAMGFADSYGLRGIFVMNNSVTGNTSSGIANSSQVSFLGTTIHHKYKAGVEYTLITMA